VWDYWSPSSNEAIEVADQVQKLAALLCVLVVGQTTRGTLRFESFVNVVQAINARY
jgi:hypothetical protein